MWPFNASVKPIPTCSDFSRSPTAFTDEKLPWKVLCLCHMQKKNLLKQLEKFRASIIVVWLSVRQSVPNSCLAHNFFIWIRILQLFHRNDYHIETTCCPQQLGRYLEGQGHSMTLQRNLVRPITSLFEVQFYNYFIKMITILRWHVTCSILVATLKVKVIVWHCSKIVSCI
jgi:hypothetical protein